jgi:hypothetical protein
MWVKSLTKKKKKKKESKKSACSTFEYSWSRYDKRNIENYKGMGWKPSSGNKVLVQFSVWRESARSFDVLHAS